MDASAFWEVIGKYNLGLDGCESALIIHNLQLK